MLQVEKLARVGQPVPLLAAFPVRVSVGKRAEPRAPISNGKRDYSTCVEEESICPIFGKSKNDVKKDD